jgi:hypothetical protein
MAEWSKAPDSSSGPLTRAWVQIPLLTEFCDFDYLYFLKICTVSDRFVFITDSCVDFNSYALFELAYYPFNSELVRPSLTPVRP